MTFFQFPRFGKNLVGSPEGFLLAYTKRTLNYYINQPKTCFSRAEQYWQATAERKNEYDVFSVGIKGNRNGKRLNASTQWRFATEKKILVFAFLLNYLFGTKFK